MKARLLLSCTAIIVLSWTVFGQSDYSQWQFRKKISTQNEQGLVRVLVDDELHDRSTPTLSDLRIVNSEGRELPFVILRGEEWRTSEKRVGKVLNNSVDPRGNSTVVLDLAERGNSHNQVRLVLDGHNYRRRVDIYGGDDARTWNLLRNDGAIFDFSSRDDSIAQTTVRYPAAIFRYLKIVIVNEGAPPMIVRDVISSSETYPTRTTRKINTQTINRVKDGPRKQSFLLIDAENKNIPLLQVDLETSLENFYRTVYILAGNDSATLLRVGTDVVFRYRTASFNNEKLSIAFPPTPARYLKIIFLDGDDQPVPITNAQATSLQYTIVFRPYKNPQWFLIANPGSMAPSYDLARTLRYVDLDSAPKVSPGQLEVNPEYAPRDERPWSDRYPALLWGVFIGVFLVLALLVIRLLKSGQTETS